MLYLLYSLLFLVPTHASFCSFAARWPCGYLSLILRTNLGNIADRGISGKQEYHASDAFGCMG